MDDNKEASITLEREVQVDVVDCSCPTEQTACKQFFVLFLVEEFVAGTWHIMRGIVAG